MTARSRPKTDVKAVASVAILALLSCGAQAADLAAVAPPAASNVVAPQAPLGWFLRFGALGVLNDTSSNLYAQPIVGVVAPGIGFVPVGGAGPQMFVAGRGAAYSNLISANVQVGYFLTPNWSLEISAVFPVWVPVRVTGYSATPPYPGTVLARVLPAAPPLTGVYHFTRFGPFQPYLGAGVAPAIALAVAKGFETGGSFDPSIGLVLQGGFDYMLTRNWGVFVDVKKIFIQLHGKATGVDLGPPVGVIPVAGSIKTNS
ncbi:MAG TPA: OmpW family outer membrane protein, partial [Roseiarcus sp.]|nr:OmpW family outer membrane protein [Roseiarcus sp.]